ncbi:hypothetical protein MA16_Dca014592 [Dendrobium catenatum]|uniref:Uncharacterized protein n=1 Tax=Dendrobium catenatum TaxID=906689 RepID=A0A2I0XJT1_9ASPA|nr:hypothetical protein MA16_Dca014592 [Dendrobium catenatum]
MRSSNSDQLEKGGGVPVIYEMLTILKLAGDWNVSFSCWNHHLTQLFGQQVSAIGLIFNNVADILQIFYLCWLTTYHSSHQWT